MHSEKGIETVKDKINNFGGMGSRYNTIQYNTIQKYQEPAAVCDKTGT